MELTLEPTSKYSLDDVQLAKSGDKLAFQRLIRCHTASMHRLAGSILRNEADIGDAVQESILKAYTNLAKLKDNEMFKSWLFKTLVNECNAILKKKRKTISLETVEELHSKNEDFLDRHHVLAAIGRLEEELKTVVILHYYEGFQVKEISSIAGIPEGTVKSRLSRARKKLYELLKD